MMTNFEKDCRAASGLLNIEVEFFGPENGEDDVFEDDCYLHVRRKGRRACFDIGKGQSLSSATQNSNARAVLDALHIKVTDRALVKEADKDDCCPNCGYRH